MLERLERIFRLGGYLAVVGFLAVRGYSLLDQRRSFPGNPSEEAAALIGKAVSVPGYQDGFAGATAVFVMSTSCHFCTASAPFYHKLTTEVALRTKGNFRSIAVLPEDPTLSNAYVKVLGVNFDSVQQGRLAGVRATPTLLLLDGRGIVKKVWVGQIPPAEEERVIAAILKTSGVSAN